MKILTAKNVLTLIGAVSLIQGIAFYFGAEMVTKGALGTLNQGDALRVGTLMHEALAGLMVFASIIVLSARNLEDSAAKKVLNGVGIGYIIFFAVAMKHFFGGEITPPIPALILLVVFMVLALITANKKSV